MSCLKKLNYLRVPHTLAGLGLLVKLPSAAFVHPAKKTGGIGYSYRRRNGEEAPVPPGLVQSYGSVPARKIVPSCVLAPRGRTRKTTSCPLFKDVSIFAKSSGLFTCCLLTSSTTSPRFNPRSSANEPCFTSWTTTPLPAEMPRRSARSGVMLRTVTP